MVLAEVNHPNCMVLMVNLWVRRLAKANRTINILLHLDNTHSSHTLPLDRLNTDNIKAPLPKAKDTPRLLREIIQILPIPPLDHALPSTNHERMAMEATNTPTAKPQPPQPAQQ